MFAVGETIGAYVIKRELGAGGMGAVYLAEHRHIERKAAIKVLLPELSSREDVVGRFFAEARATSRICHPGIVEVLDCDVLSDGRAYIVMEFLAGVTLSQAIERTGGLDVATALRIAREIADALEAAHEKGIVHRDLKPDNVFLAERQGTRAGQPPTVKILDFGVAKLLEGGDVSRTKTGSLLGTPLYMAPEQCRGASRVDHRADVYALGCILFEMLGGHPPFVYEGIGDLIMAHMSEKPVDVIAVARGPVPESVRALVARMLEKVPDARPQSMREVADAVERASVEAGGKPWPRAATLVMTATAETGAGDGGGANGNANASPNTSSPGSVGRAGGTRALSPAGPSPNANGDKIGRVGLTTLSRFATELGNDNAGKGNPRTRMIAAAIIAAALSGLVAAKVAGGGKSTATATATTTTTTTTAAAMPVVAAAGEAKAPVKAAEAAKPAEPSPGVPAAREAAPPPSPERRAVEAVAAAAPTDGDATPAADSPPARAAKHEHEHAHHSHGHHARSATTTTTPEARTPATPARAKPAYRALDDD